VRPADEYAATATPDYRTDAAWFARDEPRGRRDDPIVFYVHPTTGSGPSWFAGPADEGVDASTALVVEAQATAFPGWFWAPRYRQATTRAFAERQGEGRQAYDLAYRDVSAAFAEFLADDGACAGPSRPIVLAGHSQGARHVLSILCEYVTSADLAARLVAAYAIGIPIPADHPACTMFPVPADDHSSGVIVGWTTVLAGYPSVPAAAGTAPVCVNPLTFAATRPVAGADAHVLPRAPRHDLERVRVSARCRNGVLEVTPVEPRALDFVALPGGNLHRVDVELFTGNIRADVQRRTATWRSSQAPDRAVSNRGVSDRAQKET